MRERNVGSPQPWLSLGIVISFNTPADGKAEISAIRVGRDRRLMPKGYSTKGYHIGKDVASGRRGRAVGAGDWLAITAFTL